MEEEAYKIQDYVNDEAVAFAGAMHPKGSLLTIQMRCIHLTDIS